MIAFVHVAKTGGATVAAMLKSAHGHRYCETVPLRVESPAQKRDGKVFIGKYSSEDIRTLLDLAPRTRSLGGHQVALWSDVELVDPGTVYLLFLRDPLKRGASHFQYNLRERDMTPFFGKKHLTWDEWTDWEIPRNHQVKMLSPNVDAGEAIRLLEKKNVFVGLTERFDESLLLFRRLFVPGLRISYLRRNTAADRSVALEILGNPRRVEQMKEMYAEEFPLYRHVVNEIYPRYVKEYGSSLTDDLVRFRAGERGRVDYLNLIRYRAYRRLVFGPRYRRYMAATAAPTSEASSDG